MSCIPLKQIAKAKSVKSLRSIRSAFSEASEVEKNLLHPVWMYFQDPTLEKLFDKYQTEAFATYYYHLMIFSSICNFIYGAALWLGDVSNPDYYRLVAYIITATVNTFILSFPVFVHYFKRPLFIYQSRNLMYYMSTWLYTGVSLLVKTTLYEEADLVKYWSRMNAANGDVAMIYANNQRPLSRLYVADPLLLGVMIGLLGSFPGHFKFRLVTCWVLPVAYLIIQLLILPQDIYISSGLICSLQLYVTALAGSVLTGLSNDRFMRLNFYIAYRRLMSGRIKANIKSASHPAQSPMTNMRSDMPSEGPLSMAEHSMNSPLSVAAVRSMLDHSTIPENESEIVRSPNQLTSTPKAPEVDKKNPIENLAPTKEVPMTDEVLVKAIVENLEKNIELALDQHTNMTESNKKRSCCSCIDRKRFVYRYLWLSHPDKICEERVREHNAIRFYNTGFFNFLILTLSAATSLFYAQYQDLYASYRRETELRQWIRVFPFVIGLLFCSVGRERLPRKWVRHCERLFFILYFLAGGGAFAVYALTVNPQNRNDFDYFGFEVATEYIVLLSAFMGQVSVRYGASFCFLISVLFMGLRVTAPIATFVLLVPFLAIPFSVASCSLTERQHRLNLQK